MKVKNTNSIFFSKFSLVFRIILFMLILTIITSVLAFSIVAPISKDLRKDITKVGIGYKVVNYVGSSLTGEGYAEARADLLDAIRQIDDVMGNWSGEVIGSIVVLIFIMLIFAILYFMAYYTIADILHHFMSSNSKYGFAANYIANMKTSFQFSLLYTLYVIAMYVIGFAFAILMGLLIGKIHAILGLFIMFALAIATLACRRALVAFWMPAMVSKGLSVTDAFAKNIESLKGKFWRFFCEYYVLYTLAIAAFIVFSIVTFGVAVLIVYSAAWLYMQIKDMVEYYHLNGMKYYVDEQKVINPNKIYRDAILDEENFTL